ncbi:unnamed protein product [Oikopleura dioica]|uniref:Uncharacterized protein n=1 Tax=Oikopleura dioica TaxID=34765 RepID=E4Z1P4_OIKDI|nr:unnamed protein product [Oikopleura dioica]
MLFSQHYHDSLYNFTKKGKSLTHGEFIDLLQEERFQDKLAKIFIDSPFAAFKMETPAISSATVGNDFGMILIKANHLASATPDTVSFREHWNNCDEKSLICTFPNLGGDSLLVCPVPPRRKNGRFDFETAKTYGSIAQFFREASKDYQSAFFRSWSTNGREASNKKSKTYISTEGSGVAWLHLRFDPYPKYYSSIYRSS